jgi:hypothetical protein
MRLDAAPWGRREGWTVPCSYAVKRLFRRLSRLATHAIPQELLTADGLQLFDPHFLPVERGKVLHHLPGQWRSRSQT